ncbi:hypothetical protein AAES_122450 [Amazona aestiva]|uniref:Reverse transcriptase/retrotransposon-derived protein RNase H-like domain-containing protein n=1 Tax=Amazona aestiva TaxID=12930 RepID=A0A0Q3URD5_AMAAE|nr:hypothetical protein AAES_122450 [Amazona aestiva]
MVSGQPPTLPQPPRAGKDLKLSTTFKRFSCFPLRSHQTYLELITFCAFVPTCLNMDFVHVGEVTEIQFLGIKWQDGCCQILTDVINKITAMSPPANKKETQAFLGVVGFWRVHILNYSLIISLLYHVTWKKNDFKWGPEQQQAFEQIKGEIVHTVVLEPVRTGPDVKNVLYTAAGENGPTWSLWQKALGETQGRPLDFWSRGYRGSEASYTPTEKEILAAYEGV